MVFGGLKKALGLDPQSKQAKEDAMVEFKRRLDTEALEVNALIQGDTQDRLQQNSADAETHMQFEHERNLHNIAAKVNGEYNSRCTMFVRGHGYVGCSFNSFQ